MPRIHRRELALLGLLLGVGSLLPGASQAADERARLLVALEGDTPVAALAPLMLAQGLALERSIPQIGVYGLSASADGADEALAALKRHPAVEEAELDSILSALEEPNDVYWPSQWGLHLAGFSHAWEVTRGAELRVAVLDTGVDRTHEDLAEVLPGKDLVRDGREPSDDNGHGTAVAGIIAAVGSNGRGVAGACWRCSVLPVKVLGAGGTGHSADVGAGIVWAVDQRARVINVSLGTSRGTVALSRAIAYAAKHDVVVVAAAGNAGATAPFFPAAYEGVIAVAASDPADRIYEWSNRGDWVAVAAPGCNLTLRRGGGYGNLCGTSAAAPLVAGLAALVRSARPSATATETERIVERAVARIGPAVERGRVDAALAFPARQTTRADAAPRTPTRRGLQRRMRHVRREELRRLPALAARGTRPRTINLR